jgi:LmbE family N-acetylglucosaminyl deacetylase
MSAGELRAALRKLEVVGSVLYVGAHPDDDNTSLLACLSRQRRLRTAYVSLTRGDGGQNILGPETGELLGVIRTEELLASRSVDGAEQYFTRALDFGFSKNPEETLALWGHERALGDLVWVIRRFEPDVIVTRFGTDGSGGHGHHTASAILAGEAFRAAADPTRFPDQLRRVPVWQAKRLLWNTFNPRLADRAASLPPLLTLDAGGYDPLLGVSYPEIGGRARSLNRSQGAGTPEGRAPRIEYFEAVDGVPAAHDLMDGVVLDWSRFKGGARVQALLNDAERRFDPDHPDRVLPLLARAHAALAGLDPNPMVEAKRRDLERVMRSCAGLWLEAIAETWAVSPRDSLSLTFTVIDRAAAPATLERIDVPGGIARYVAEAALAPGAARSTSPREPLSDQTPLAGPVNAAPRILTSGKPVVARARVLIPADLGLTHPSWLNRPGDSLSTPDPARLGDAEDPPARMARFTVRLGGEPVNFDVPVSYRWTDRVYGDRYRALEILPAVTCRFDQAVYLFPDSGPRDVRIAAQSTRLTMDGVARLRLPPGWRAEPPERPVHLEPGTEQQVSFCVFPSGGPEASTLAAEVVVDGRSYTRRLIRIDYPHIPIQTLLPPAEARAVRADLKHAGDAIGYVMGSGDAGPDALRQMGYRVTLLGDDDLESADLSRFSTIVTGVRAYNTRPRLRVLQPRLLEYVQNGGRLVVQYTTPERALDDRLGPWPFKISGDRVTVESAEMRTPHPAHPLLTTPNAIGPRDWEGWVQERGLYYANPWDPRYDTVVSANDPGETPKDGGLLYTRYGRGTFVFTALAFFRQLPAGVPGAWRLFANLVSPAP